LFLSFPTRRSSDLASAIPRPASTSALAGSGAVSAVSAAAGVLSGVDSLAFVAEGVASSAGAEDFTLDVGLSATAAEAVDESVVAADEGVFLAGVDLAAAEDSAAVVADEEFFTVFVAELCDTVGVVSVSSSCCLRSSYPCSSHRLSSCSPTVSRSRTSSSSKLLQPRSCAYRTSQPSHRSRRPSFQQFSSRRPSSQQSSTASSTSSSSMPIHSSCSSQSCPQMHPSTYERKRPSSCVDGRTAW